MDISDRIFGIKKVEIKPKFFSRSNTNLYDLRKVNVSQVPNLKIQSSTSLFHSTSLEGFRWQTEAKAGGRGLRERGTNEERRVCEPARDNSQIWCDQLPDWPRYSCIINDLKKLMEFVTKIIKLINALGLDILNLRICTSFYIFNEKHCHLPLAPTLITLSYHCLWH